MPQRKPRLQKVLPVKCIKGFARCVRLHLSTHLLSLVVTMSLSKLMSHCSATNLSIIMDGLQEVNNGFLARWTHLPIHPLDIWNLSPDEMHRHCSPSYRPIPHQVRSLILMSAGPTIPWYNCQMFPATQQ